MKLHLPLNLLAALITSFSGVTLGVDAEFLQDFNLAFIAARMGGSAQGPQVMVLADALELGEHMVEAAVADVVGPAVAAHDPHGLLVQVILLGEDVGSELAGVAVADSLAGSLELLAVGLYLGVVAGAKFVNGADAVLKGPSWTMPAFARCSAVERYLP